MDKGSGEKMYKRILIKLSGESLEDGKKTISKSSLDGFFAQVKYLKEKYNIQISIVVGGGNIMRGKISELLGMGADTSSADYMGMMATTINALALKTYFNNNGLRSDMLNALEFEDIAEKVSKEKSKKILEDGKILIFGGGTGKPYVSTDTAASLRAIEVEADAIFIAKNGIDGVYDKDPNIYKDAKFIKEITYSDIFTKNLQVIDSKAAEMLSNHERNIESVIFNVKGKDNIIKIYENQLDKFTKLVKAKK